MITLQWSWLLLLLPVPLLVRWLLPPASPGETAALRVPDLGVFAGPSLTPQNITYSDTLSRGNEHQSPWFWVGLLAWGLLVIAAARPVWVGEAVELPVSGRDLMLAVDLSGSMATRDFAYQGRQLTRLEAIQKVAGEFIRRRVGDRLGLILFGRQPYLQTPLTFDRKTVGQMLDEAAIGLAGKETAIGDAIGLAVKRLRREPEGDRVLVLLTDGANTAGEVDPLEAARLAADAGVTIYPIGIGAREMIVDTFFGPRRVNPAADLDEKTLRSIAEITGGRYFRAEDTRELAQIYRLIDELQPVTHDPQTYRPCHVLFYWPLAVALALAVLIVLGRGLRGE